MPRLYVPTRCWSRPHSRCGEHAPLAEKSIHSKENECHALKRKLWSTSLIIRRISSPCHSTWFVVFLPLRSFFVGE